MLLHWDAANIRHIARHRVTTAEAEQVINSRPYDWEMQTINGEERLASIGETATGRVLVVITAFVEDEGAIRVVTAFPPPASFRRRYFELKGNDNGAISCDEKSSESGGRRGILVGRKKGVG